MTDREWFADNIRHARSMLRLYGGLAEKFSDNEDIQSLLYENVASEHWIIKTNLDRLKDKAYDKELQSRET